MTENGKNADPWPSTESRLALLFLAALLIVAGIAAFVPRPNIALRDVAFAETLCDPTTMTRSAVSRFSLSNSGDLEGFVIVRFYVDARRADDTAFIVPAHTSVRLEMTVALPDCSTHRYSLDTCIPSGEGATC